VSAPSGAILDAPKPLQMQTGVALGVNRQRVLLRIIAISSSTPMRQRLRLHHRAPSLICLYDMARITIIETGRVPGKYRERHGSFRTCSSA
jgi:hypothetical protein